MRHTGPERDTLTGFLRDLDTRLTRQERHTHGIGGGGGGGGVNEVWIGTTDPIATNPTIELWYNPEAGEA